MFKFTASSRIAKGSSGSRKLPESKDMDWEEDTSGLKTGITAPGETIVSSLDFMRQGLQCNFDLRY
jgi:hypothetical protein